MALTNPYQIILAHRAAFREVFGVELDDAQAGAIGRVETKRQIYDQVGVNFNDPRRAEFEKRAIYYGEIGYAERIAQPGPNATRVVIPGIAEAYMTDARQTEARAAKPKKQILSQAEVLAQDRKKAALQRLFEARQTTKPAKITPASEKVQSLADRFMDRSKPRTYEGRAALAYQYRELQQVEKKLQDSGIKIDKKIMAKVAKEKAQAAEALRKYDKAMAKPPKVYTGRQALAYTYRQIRKAEESGLAGSPGFAAKLKESRKEVGDALREMDEPVEPVDYKVSRFSNAPKGSIYDQYNRAMARAEKIDAFLQRFDKNIDKRFSQSPLGRNKFAREESKLVGLGTAAIAGETVKAFDKTKLVVRGLTVTPKETVKEVIAAGKRTPGQAKAIAVETYDPTTPRGQIAIAATLIAPGVAALRKTRSPTPRTPGKIISDINIKGTARTKLETTGRIRKDVPGTNPKIKVKYVEADANPINQVLGRNVKTEIVKQPSGNVQKIQKMPDKTTYVSYQKAGSDKVTVIRYDKNGKLMSKVEAKPVKGKQIDIAMQVDNIAKSKPQTNKKGTLLVQKQRMQQSGYVNVQDGRKVSFSGTVSSVTKRKTVSRVMKPEEVFPKQILSSSTGRAAPGKARISEILGEIDEKNYSVPVQLVPGKSKGRRSALRTTNRQDVEIVREPSTLTTNALTRQKLIQAAIVRTRIAQRLKMKGVLIRQVKRKNLLPNVDQLLANRRASLGRSVTRQKATYKISTPLGKGAQRFSVPLISAKMRKIRAGNLPLVGTKDKAKQIESQRNAIRAKRTPLTVPRVTFNQATKPIVIPVVTPEEKPGQVIIEDQRITPKRRTVPVQTPITVQWTKKVPVTVVTERDPNPIVPSITPIGGGGGGGVPLWWAGIGKRAASYGGSVIPKSSVKYNPSLKAVIKNIRRKGKAPKTRISGLGLRPILVRSGGSQVSV